MILVQNQNTSVVEWGRTKSLFKSDLVLIKKTYIPLANVMISVQNQKTSVVEWGEQRYCIASNSSLGSRSLIENLYFASKGNNM